MADCVKFDSIHCSSDKVGVIEYLNNIFHFFYVNISETNISNCTSFMCKFIFPCQPDLCGKCRLKI